ncbi:MAG: hypothetical protein HFI08_02625 [Bacilli bacterium]|nr:hypothetical protein [Bacilli bacterium]
MQKNKLFFILLVFFMGILPVSALSSGVLDSTKYEETDKKTNYIKMELQDGNVILFQISTTNSALAREFKEKIFAEYYDGFTLTQAPGWYQTNSSSVDKTTCNFNQFKTPEFGDLVAKYENDECSVANFEIFAKERGDSKSPIIGSVIAGKSVIQGSMSGIKSIRFVTISKENDSSSNNGGNGSTEVVKPAVTSHCSDLELLKTFKFIGKILSVVKILIPLILIILGAIDFFRAVIASKDDEIKKSMKTLMYRTLAGVCIFFLPTIINLVFRLIDDWGNYKTDYSVCSTCVTNPSKCKV